MKNILLIGLLLFISQEILAQKRPSTLAEKQAKPRTATNPWETKLQAAKTDTAKLRICIKAGDFYKFNKVNYDSGRFFLQKGLIINNKLGTNKLSSSLFLSLGGLEVNFDLDKSDFYTKQSQQIALQQNDIIKYKKATFNLITSLKRREAYGSAIKQFLAFDRTIDNKTHQDSIIKLVLYRNLKDCYQNLEDKEKSYFYNQKMLPYCKTLKDTLSIYQNKFSWNVMFNSSLDSNAYSNIIKLSEKLRYLDDKIGSRVNLSVDLSDYYIRIKQYDKAIEIGQSAIKMAGNILELENYKMYAYQNISEAYTGKKQYTEALKYQLKMTNYLDKDVRLKYIAYKQLVIIYVGLGNYKKAYEYSTKIAAHEEEVKGDRNKQAVAEIDAELAAMEKQAQLAKSELNTKVQQARIETEKQQKTIVIALLLVSLGLLLWALWSYNKQRQLKNTLQIQNLKLAEQTQALEVKTQELSEANQTKDKIFAVIGHDLQSPIADLSAITSLFESKDIASSDVIELMPPLSDKMNAVQLMLNNLLQWSLIELNYQKSNNSHVADLQHIIENVVRQVQQNADKKTIQVFTQIQPSQIRANEHDIEVVLRNLMSNAIKFTPPNGRINLSVKADSNFVEVSLSDTGIGFEFREEEQFLSSKASTVGERGLGLGLKICRELVKNNGGTIDISSQLDTGTSVVLRFPVAA